MKRLLRIFKNHNSTIRGPQSDVVTKPLVSQPEVPLPPGWAASTGTDIGTRDYQQDALRLEASDREILALICDGMGGLASGADASKAAADAFCALYHQHQSENLPDFFRAAVPQLNRAVLQAAPGGGTTLVATVVREDRLCFLSVGDSKLYILREGQLVNATREHNYKTLLGEGLLNGTITPEQYARQISRGEALVSYLGAGQVEYMEVSAAPVQLQPGDTVLLCSDGLYKSLPEADLERIISGYSGSFSTLAPYLIDTAVRRCSRRDNTSLILLRYEGLEGQL